MQWQPHIVFASFEPMKYPQNYHPERASKALASLALVEFTLASCFSTSSCETIVFEIKGWSGFMYTEGSFISDNFPWKETIYIMNKLDNVYIYIHKYNWDYNIISKELKLTSIYLSTGLAVNGTIVHVYISWNTGKKNVIFNTRSHWFKMCRKEKRLIFFIRIWCT